MTKQGGIWFNIDPTSIKVPSKQGEIREGIDRELDAFAQTLLLHPFKLEQLKGIASKSIKDYLHSQDVVIKVERELPEITYEPCPLIKGRLMAQMINLKKAGYVAVEPLIEEKK